MGRLKIAVCLGALLVFHSPLITSELVAQKDDPSRYRGQLIASGGGPGGVNSACIACHGTAGGGDVGSAFPRIAGLNAFYIAKQLEDYASGSRPNDIMTPIAVQLSTNDRRSLALYYAGLKVPDSPIGTRPGAVDTSQRIQAAASLFAQGSSSLRIQGCANCHGRDGRGLHSTYPALAGQPAAYTAEQLRVFRANIRTNDIGATMRTIVKSLRNEDIESLALYLEIMKP